MRTPIRKSRKRDLRQRTVSLAWEDLRTVLAVTRSGSLSGAARELGIEHSTVFRRVDELESRLALKLFERTRTGYVATEHGEAVADSARVMEDAALAAERRLLGADARLTGVVRIATSEMLASYLLPVPMRAFLDRHPGLEVEFDVAYRAVDLARREADIAVRATNDPPDTVIGRQVADLHYAVFASRELVGRGEPKLDALPWLGFDDRTAGLAVARWLRATWPNVTVRARFDSLLAMMSAAARGLGVAVLPAFAAAQVPGLVRISEPLESPRMGLWLLTHPDVRNNARVRALSAHLVEAIPAELARLAQGAPCAARVAEPGEAPKRGSARRAKRIR